MIEPDQGAEHRPSAESFAVVALIEGPAARLEAILATVRAALDPDPPATLVGAAAGEPMSAGVEAVLAATAAGAHVVVVTDDVRVAPGSLAHALSVLRGDPRVSTVSFLSAPDDDGGDEVVRTTALRDLAPTPPMAPIGVPDGVLTILSRHALAACGGLLADTTLSPRALVVEFALRARRAGFASVIDTATSVTRSAVGLASSEWDDLARLHPTLHVSWHEDRSAGSPGELARSVSTSKVRGLTVTIDGTSLRRNEMGTQVHTTALVAALATHGDVGRITVVVNDAVPSYAHAALGHPKVDVVGATGLDFSRVPLSDVLHRPFQPDSPIPFGAWRDRASRIVVGVQDLILYQVGSYFPDATAWLAFRVALRDSVAASDAVTVISADVREQVVAEALPVEPSRLFSVALGTDHLRGDVAMAAPCELELAVGRQFLLVLGTDYPHKHREIAVGAWHLLRETWAGLDLVLAGAAMPPGDAVSDQRTAAEDGLHVMTDVSTPERNWLLRHAAVVLYPTSAEGFGFVPFEAARFDTPTISVPFGPLRELSGPLPVGAETWTPAAFASATAALLQDPDLARRQVAASAAAAERYTWRSTADRMVEIYRDVLSRPAVAVAPLHEVRRELANARADVAVAQRELAAIRASGSYRLAMRISASLRAVRRH